MAGSTQAYRILVVDNEPDILDILQYNLEKEGYVVRTANNGKEGEKEAKAFLPDLILLDIMMPVQDGVETCRQIRLMPELEDVYVIMLTARAEEYSVLAAFDAGADDYIVKPMRPRALMSRINAFFRRKLEKEQRKKLICISDLMIDKISCKVNVGEWQVALAKKEFELLFYMAQHPNKVFSREDLIKNIWGPDVKVMTRTIDVHVRKVREKIGEGYITTVTGVGYMFTMK